MMLISAHLQNRIFLDELSFGGAEKIELDEWDFDFPALEWRSSGPFQASKSLHSFHRFPLNGLKPGAVGAHSLLHGPLLIRRQHPGPVNISDMPECYGTTTVPTYYVPLCYLQW